MEIENDKIFVAVMGNGRYLVEGSEEDLFAVVHEKQENPQFMAEVRLWEEENKFNVHGDEIMHKKLSDYLLQEED